MCIASSCTYRVLFLLSSGHMLLARIINDSGDEYIDETAMEHVAGDAHIAFGYNLIALYEQKVAEVKTLFPQDTAV